MAMIRMKASTWYIGGRLLQAIPLIFWVIVINFVIIHLAPGDPVSFLAGQYEATPEYMEAMRKEFGLDKPPDHAARCLPVQSGPGRPGIFHADETARAGIDSVAVARHVPPHGHGHVLFHLARRLSGRHSILAVRAWPKTQPLFLRSPVIPCRPSGWGRSS